MISAYDYFSHTSHISKTLDSRYNSRFELSEHHTTGQIGEITQVSIWGRCWRGDGGGGGVSLYNKANSVPGQLNKCLQ